MRYRQSEALLERALKSIPLGSQTFSKSHVQYPRGVSPHFIRRGSGSHVWDADGNEYVDFVSGLASVTLGYCDPDVDAAVREQLGNGVTFSLPHTLEIEVAEAICEMVPCAQMVRFGKNGSDATTAAIRLARAFTGRDHVAVCGYHGWQDWYIGSTARNGGVPRATCELTHSFTYNDPDSLQRVLDTYPIAAVILEPMNAAWPAPGYLEDVRQRSHRHGALLVFDETVTGFRYANGGAQELFGVTPDLATFGKGLANGFPLSAVAGRADVMRLMEEVFVSSTFGGETLSLAAALATLHKLQCEPVVDTLRRQGQKVIGHLRATIARNAAEDFLSVSGHPSWSFLVMQDAGPYTSPQVKTLYLQEMLARGVLCLGSHNMSYSHSDADLAQLFAAYDDVIPLMAEAVRGRTLESKLRCEPLQPLFRVR